MENITTIDIKYLIILTQYPSYTDKITGYTKQLQPLSDSDITNLEALYNNGNSFPIALTELLSLAGAYCYVLDYGASGSLIQLQVRARKLLTNSDYSISRPFLAIDLYGGDQFLFLYLDEGGDNPIVYQAIPYAEAYEEWLLDTNTNLSSYINSTMKTFLSGYNPF